MASETENEYIEGSIFDLNDEWKPVGLVPKHRSRNRKLKLLIFFSVITTFSYIIYYVLNSTYSSVG